MYTYIIKFYSLALVIDSKINQNKSNTAIFYCSLIYLPLFATLSLRGTLFSVQVQWVYLILSFEWVSFCKYEDIWSFLFQAILVSFKVSIVVTTVGLI